MSQVNEAAGGTAVNVAPSCLVCGENNWSTKWPGLLECGNCRFITADLVDFDADRLHELYGHDYFHGEEYHDYIAEKAITQRSFRLRMRRLDKFIDPARHRSVLEVGSAYGFFLDLVRNRFQRLVGVDVARDAVKYAQEQGLDVRLADLPSLDLTGPFDLVCMWDTIEHLADPGQHLAKIADLTEPGALIAITTGDIGSRLARARGRQWRLIHPPTHLHYFSEDTLTRILDRYGFAVRDSSYCGGFRSLEFAANFVLKVRWKKPNLFERLRRTGLLRVAPYVNMFDIRYIIAEKVR